MVLLEGLFVVVGFDVETVSVWPWLLVSTQHRDTPCGMTKENENVENMESIHPAQRILKCNRNPGRWSKSTLDQFNSKENSSFATMEALKMLASVGLQ